MRRWSWLATTSALIFICLALHVVAHSWVADDAYITFRVVDNIVHGLGAVWNTDERVQAYTHPLWMLLHVPFYALTGNIYYTTILLSWACFALAILVCLRNSGRSLEEAAFGFALPLALCVPVMDFAVSGLENPLSMLLLACIATTVLRPPLAPRYWLSLSLFSALLLLTRMDLVLIIIPLWGWLLWRYRGSMRWRQVFAGALPLLAWHGFSLFYYGFVFPNTKYAKLSNGIPARELIGQGGYYAVDLLLRDLFSALLLLALLIWTAGKTIQRARMPRPFSHEAAAGVALAWGGAGYCCYTIAVGGDFMGGRFWSVPLFLAIFLLFRNLPRGYLQSPKRAAIWAVCLVALAVAAFAIRAAAWQAGCAALAWQGDKTHMCALHGIIDERQYYAKNSFLFPPDWLPLRNEPDGIWISEGRQWRAQPPVVPPVVNMIGFHGFYAGPQVILIDKFALSEPLLARLPIKAGEWRIGHFERALPEGFMRARATGDFSGMDPDLASYYRALREIVSGDVWSSARLRTLAQFQLGAYDGLLRRYVARHCGEFYQGCR